MVVVSSSSKWHRVRDTCPTFVFNEEAKQAITAPCKKLFVHICLSEAVIRFSLKPSAKQAGVEELLIGHLSKCFFPRIGFPVFLLKFCLNNL